MKYDMTRPCDNCPFLKKGGIRLSPSRVREIAGGMLDSQGRSFACHKTVHADSDSDEDEVSSYDGLTGKHCAGALIFAEKHETATQMMRISERIGLYDARTLMSDKAAVESVFDSLRQMLRTAIR